MVRHHAILAAVLAGVVAACGANPARSPIPSVTPTDVAGSASPTVTDVSTPSPAPTSSPPVISPSPIPVSAPTPTLLPVPAKPAGVEFDEQMTVSDDESVADITQTVRWRTPRSDGVEIRVYGVTSCIAYPDNPAPGTSGPCLVVRTPLPASVRTLLGAAPASAGAVSWSWTEEPGCDIGLHQDPDTPRYYAIVLAAYSEVDHSIFTIAEPGLWFAYGPNDTIC